MTSWDVSSFSQGKRPFSEVAPSCNPKNGTFPHYSLSGSWKFSGPLFFLVTGKGKNKGQFQLPAGHSIAGLWNLGKKREAGVYLGWEMSGLGNRTLCHSLCHSPSDPDLFPAFLTPPLSWEKCWSSCNSESTPSVLRLNKKIRFVFEKLPLSP